MKVQGARPSLLHAETHAEYLPRPGINRLQMAVKLVDDVKRAQHEDPALRVHSRLLDALTGHLEAIEPLPGISTEDDGWSAPQRIVWRYGTFQRMPLPPERKAEILADKTVHKTGTALVRVNAGRWVVDCPNPYCNGAQAASWDDRRFFCVDCANHTFGGQWIKVVWPDDPHAIEDELARRPMEVQHWHPGETREDLAHQDALALGTVTVDTSKYPKKAMRWVDADHTVSEPFLIDGKQPRVLRFGTPEWDKAQEAGANG